MSKEKLIEQFAQDLRKTDLYTKTYKEQAEILWKKGYGKFYETPIVLTNIQYEKEIPKKVKGCGLSNDKEIVGYCPNCDGTVHIKLTSLIKIKGHHCSWCGQKIDLTGEDYEN